MGKVLCSLPATSSSGGTLAAPLDRKVLGVVLLLHRRVLGILLHRRFRGILLHRRVLGIVLL